MFEMKIIYAFLVCIIIAGCNKSMINNEEMAEDNIESINLSRADWVSPPRRMTTEERLQYGKSWKYFAEERDEVIVTDNETKRYNCIAFAMGRTDMWLNPSCELDKFQEDFEHAHSRYNAPYNFKRVSVWAPNTAVDGWGYTGAISCMCHASAYNYMYSVYESKLGRGIRVTHIRDAFDEIGNIYGYLQISFVVSEHYPYRTLSSMIDDCKESISEQERMQIINEVQKIAAGKERFDMLFSKWKESWATNPETRFSSDTRDCKKLPEFTEMLRMGSAIIPLLMEKLLDSEENFIGLVLYDELQWDETLKITYSANDVRVFEGEQQRAIRTCKSWAKALNN